MRRYFAFILIPLVVHAQMADITQEGSLDETPEAAQSVAVDENKAVAPRAIGEPFGQDKFSVYIGTIDGVRRMVFNEVEGGSDNIGPDGGNGRADPFGAYDDNLVVNSENEKTIFVPRPYRPGAKEEETTTTTTTTQRPTTPFTTTRRPFIQQTTFAPQPPQPRPQPQQPPRVQLPQRPVFRPQPTPPPHTLPPFITPPQITRPPVQDTTPNTFQSTDPTGLRNGQCHNSIFYISTPINGPTRLTFTHFAIAVTVDQCARTCHEFNCAIAHYNPINGHCEFNPSTAFAIRNGQCPAWPSLHYRNNVVASEPVRIFCVTCQKPRRRINRGGRPGRGSSRPSKRGIFSNSRGISNSFLSSEASAHGVISHPIAIQPSAFNDELE